MHMGRKSNHGQTWLDDVAADDTYVILWSAADDAEPSDALTTEQLGSIRAHFAAASEAQLDRYIGTEPDGRTVADAANQVVEWSQLFLRQDEMSPEAYAALVARYPSYAVGVAYAAGELVAYNGNLYEVVQAHTSQADWIPSELPALYTHAVPQSVVPIWVQPLGSFDAYQLGDKVTYQGQIWQSTINANVWPPGTGSLWHWSSGGR